MKPLNKYISEGIIGNLGISNEIDNTITSEWVDAYNKMVKRSAERAMILENNVVLIKDMLYITDSQLENGKLPEYIKFRFDCDNSLDFHVKVNATTFCSTEGFPALTGRNQKQTRYSFFIDASADVIDFSYLPVDGLKKIFIYNANLGPKDLSSLPKTLSGITIRNLTKNNCKVITTIPKNLVLYSDLPICTHVDLAGDMRGCEQILADFFKNTTINSKTHDGMVDISDLTILDFEFLTNSKKSSKYKLITGISLDAYNKLINDTDACIKFFEPLETTNAIKSIRFRESESNPYNISSEKIVKLADNIKLKRGDFIYKKYEIW